MKRFIIGSLFVVMILASCQCPDDPLPPGNNPKMSGTWQASGSFSGIQFLVEMSLSESDNQEHTVGGTGKLSAVLGSADFNVTGRNLYPDVSLVFFNFSDTLAWDGQFSEANDNQLNGLLQAPGFGLKDYSLQFNRTANMRLEPSVTSLSLKELFRQ